MHENVYQNWQEAPHKYYVEETLQYVAEKRSHIEIVARTGFRFLCGDEKTFEINQVAFEQTQQQLQKQIQETILSGGSIHFILQNPNLPVPFFDQDESNRLQRHAHAAIQSYETISAGLEMADLQRFKLSFIDEIVEYSMLRIIEDKKIVRLVRDLGSNFKPLDNSRNTVFKPVLVIESRKPSIQLFENEFEHILNTAIPKEQFDEVASEARQKIKNLIEAYPHHSKLRKDKSRQVAVWAARHFLADRDSQIESKNRLPPVSIQLLVTNACTTHCTMCDHYKLSRQNPPDLTDNELKYTLKCIKDLGTRSVIISGGEPLARTSLFSLLEYGKGLGLHLGLLTNGIKKGDESISAEEARIIASTCAWVQMSIDSFDETTYAQIRRGGHLTTALDTLEQITKAGLSDVEVCFTIQRENIEELSTVQRKIESLLPASVSVRFKFAHGPSNDREFLCLPAQLRENTREIVPENLQANFSYLFKMINDGHFDYEGIAEGAPLKTAMVMYQQKGYKCQVLRLTCKIDAKGDVYPCCFLFDDNSAASQIRTLHKLGSLRSDRTGHIMDPDQYENALIKIWYENDRLKLHRNIVLPVDVDACKYCTRHFYQNSFLNESFHIFQDYPYSGVIEELASTEVDDFWL
jgi:MoaA/NifB/PqqE/SkfB family radical SAM enzyme